MSEETNYLLELSTPGLTLSRTIQAVEQLESHGQTHREMAIGVASNVSIDLLSVFLRKHALLAGARVSVDMGSHDDVLTDAGRYVEAGKQAMVYLPFFDNLLPAFEFQIECLPHADILAKEADFRAQCELMFQSTLALPALYVGTFHRHVRAVDVGRPDSVAATLDRFNAVLRELAARHAHVRLIDTEDILRSLGAGSCLDRRFYLRSTAPYSPIFLDEFARRIALASRGFGGYFFKALVLDCDNTLWGGVVGEDLVDGIKLDPHAYPGRVYWQAQLAYAGLERQGVLLCLCSKNNPPDVDEVLERHPNQVLREARITLKKVNWKDKVTNLREIASELNIGLDSLVFVDDSDFECASVRTALPQVRVFQVPKALPDYGRVLREIRELFLAGGVSDESRSKTEQYRQIQQASNEQSRYASHEDYLTSLELKVSLRRDSIADIARISELTQKSNQFNLTTLRQTPGEIQDRMQGDDSCVYSLNVGDRFGPAGLTGVVIVDWRDDVACIAAFLMSCRVIGRGVEFSIWPHIAADALHRGCRILEAAYRPTAKNSQVADFFDRLGIPLVESDDGVKRYRVNLDEFQPSNADWIKVSHGE
ncbi:MAG: HAD-IIIC family phosphatase [Burkholderiales bacterium]|nr:HAD-IIIC family phosphatase [Burkholderiales bacterium]